MSARKSPRHAELLVDKLTESDLFRDLADRASKRRLKGDPESLSELLWKSTQSQQNDALKSKFIQGLKNVNLDPTDFGGYMVQDCIYCYYSKESIDTAKENAKDPKLKEFLKERSDKYKDYYEKLFKEWHINGPKGIDLSKACQEYADLEMKVAKQKDPIYLVVALIPCSRLWPWLGQEIWKTPPDFGVYTKWVNDNLNPNCASYKKLEKIIDDAYLVNAIDKNEAFKVYQGCMTGEANFFNCV